MALFLDFSYHGELPGEMASLVAFCACAVLTEPIHKATITVPGIRA